jgi:CheY-like chemotaxis protein/tetratricopeptide (TPR) repeat protein
MKLELEFPSPSSPVGHQFTALTSFAEPSEILQAGINFAKEGKRPEARQFLLRVVADEPENETAWLWLASVSEYPEELLVFLQNVLKVNPANERALEWQKSTKTMLAKTFVERGVDAAQENQKEFANHCFTQALRHDNENEMAWLWLATNSDSPEEKTAHLQKVLSINPENETALASLKSLKHEMTQSLLKKANSAAISGEREQARELLEEAMQSAPELEEAWILKAYLADDSQEKIACYEKILDLNPENVAAQAGLASLQDLLQRAVEKKSNAETLQEVFASSSENLSDSEESNDFSEEVYETATIEIIDEPIFEVGEVENQPEEFSFEAEDDTVSEHFETPTDELDTDFVEEVKAQSSFSDAAAVEVNEELAVSLQSEEFGGEAEVQIPAGEVDAPAYSFFEETNEPLENQAFEQNNLSAENSYEEENIFGDINFDEMPVVVQAQTSQPVEEFSQPAEDSNSYKTTFLEQSYLDKVEIESENFAAAKEVAQPEVEFNERAEASLQGDAAPNSESENPIHRTPMQIESFACPFCFVTNEPQAFICRSCHMMLSLSDMEMLLSHSGAAPEVIEMAIEDLESEKASRHLTEAELTNLGIAYLNAKNLRAALACLQEAAQLNSNNIVLGSKVNFLAIRLSEIEAHDSKVEAMPARSLTIMVIDDSPTVRKLISGKLEKSGHTVVAASDGPEALEKIVEVIPDLILLDIMMPQMDGYQVCKLIRSNEPTKDVPVVMISGKDGFFDKVRGRMAGTTGFISKPFGPETLMKTIETYVV